MILRKDPRSSVRSQDRYVSTTRTAVVLFLIIALMTNHNQLSHAFRIIVPPLPGRTIDVRNFYPTTHYQLRLKQTQAQLQARTVLYSSIGGGGDDGGGSKGENNSWGDFLDPKEESENLRKARDYISEESLPISYDNSNDDDYDDDTIKEDEEDQLELSDDDEVENDKDDDGEEKISELLGGDDKVASPFGGVSSALMQVGGGSHPFEAPSADALAKNPYLAVVTKLTPSELISKFTGTANPRVQEAVRTTILGLIGGLPKLAFETTTITTGQRLASLMFQLQMTGYMFKNAEYRLSLQQSLGLSDSDLTKLSKQSQLLLKGGTDNDDNDDEDEEATDALSGKVRGKLRLRYGGKPPSNDSDGGDSSSSDDSDNGVEVEVDAEAYMSELRAEVSKLRDELTQTRQAKDEAVRKDLLLYIRTLPDQQLRSLTGDMGQDVLVAMKGLVNAVLSGIGEGKITPNTVTEQSGEALAQLCMWQLVVGYNLRELEVREEIKNSLFSSSKSDDDESEGGVDFSEPGVLE